MRKFILCISVLSLLFGCIACENGKVSRSNVGAVGGGLAGALIGSTVGKGSGKSVANCYRSNTWFVSRKCIR